MTTILPESISLRLLFARRQTISFDRNISVSKSTHRERGDEVLHRLKEAIALITEQEISQITEETSFEELFPRRNRRKKLKELRKATGYTTPLLRPKQWLYYTSALLFLLSMLGLFVSGLYGLTGILFTMLFFYIGYITGIEFIYPTVGQAAEKITIDQLVQSDSIV